MRPRTRRRTSVKMLCQISSRRLSFGNLPCAVREREVAFLLRLIRPASNRGFRENISRLTLSLFSLRRASEVGQQSDGRCIFTEITRGRRFRAPIAIRNRYQNDDCAYIMWSRNYGGAIGFMNEIKARTCCRRRVVLPSIIVRAKCNYRLYNISM